VSDYDPAWAECFIPGKTIVDRGAGAGSRGRVCHYVLIFI
jgi:hypothetical protein